MSISYLNYNIPNAGNNIRCNNLIVDGSTYNISSPFQIIREPDDFPPAVNGVRTLEDNYTYLIVQVVDLLGDRLVCGQNTTIIGGSSENCRLKSTGLTDALLTSVWSLPMRFLTIEAKLALDLQATNATQALDWNGVNFTDCEVVGLIKDYSNFIMVNSSFLGSGGLTFDGTIGTIGLQGSLLQNNSQGNACIIIPATCTITRRFRIIYSSLIILGSQVGLDVSSTLTIPNEGYILDTVNFAGGGTYLSGLDQTSNKSLFINCVGIDNTSVDGQLYMSNNVKPTTVSATNVFYKVAGTTIASDLDKFDHSLNRLTCRAAISRKYLMQSTMSFTSGNNNVCEFGIYDSQSAGMLTPSKVKSTANSAGRAENIALFTTLRMIDGDYVEIHCANTSAVTDITVSDMNFLIVED